MSEEKVGVGDGRLCPAKAVCGWSRLGAGALGAYLEKAYFVRARNTATAGANLNEIDSRNANRQAAALDEPLLARGLERMRDERLAIVDQAHFRCRAAHVERQ